ncbi:MAG: hypothetical protein KC420_20960 [Myxococcales bacterium]|nr:hypothetical protein [Myxococcales bacterium]MCB9701185.1 hypothetical protein [Myxococcales bacterium]
MPLVPLAPDMSNKAAFVNSLFDDDVRHPASNPLGAAIASGQLSFSYADPTSRGLILGAWLAGWQSLTGGSPDPTALARCPRQDLQLLGLLASYIKANALDLCAPQLTFNTINQSGLAVYTDTGYTRQPFLDGDTWRYGAFSEAGVVIGDPTHASVALLLEQIFYGAHIVAISSRKDGASGVPTFQSQLDRSLPNRTDLANSHYGGSGIASGSYFAPSGAPTPTLTAPDIETLATSDPPGDEPLLFAFLVGVTASTYANDFIQLEGWPSQTVVSPAGGARHNADFVANQSTLWNFSTFGASVHSEKRSTPLFLAQASFDLTIHLDTGMPYYWGANAGNVGASWMHPYLVIIPR